ncbi:MAG: hypothetical protein E5W44_13225 [Mesorhizobium sp.]|nr:MAG: hypothetical protein E5W44_13225 [Mesorhizobium sp.]
MTEDVILGEAKRPSSSLSKQFQPLRAPATAERLADDHAAAKGKIETAAKAPCAHPPIGQLRL